MRVVFFDLETGGLNQWKHAIIQIAAIAVDERFEPVDEFECKVQFKLENADQDALKVNSYDPVVWDAVAIPPAQAADDFGEFLKRYADVELVSRKSGKPYKVTQMAGHNADRFDGPFLTNWYRRLKKFCPAYSAVLDTCQLARWTMQGAKGKPEDFKLGTLAEFLGIDHVDAHDALSDVRVAVEIAKILHGGGA